MVATESVAADNQRERTSHILQWMSVATSDFDHQDILVDKKMGSDYAHSGSWLYEHPKFSTWLSPRGLNEPPLWICGSVGKGKTSMVARIIERSLQNAQAESSAKVCYFSCSRKQGRREDPGSDPATILRSLIRQLAWKIDCGSLEAPIINIYEKLSMRRQG